MSTLLTAWNRDPTVIAGCAGLVVAYVWALRASQREGPHCGPHRSRSVIAPAIAAAGGAGPHPNGEDTALRPAGPRPAGAGAPPLGFGPQPDPLSRLTAYRPSAAQPDSPWRPISFLAGVAVVFLALESPLDTLADTYLFSAHMAQHLLLILVAPPLMLLGVPPRVVGALLAWRPAAACERALSRPPVAWAVGVLTVWLWHLPRLYDAAVASEDVHVVQHLTFLVAATIFWWPVVAPAPYRLATWPAIGYLALGGFANTVLAIVITLAPAGLYPIYGQPVDRLGILPLLRGRWGLTPGVDQQLGGVLMWIPGGWAYLLAIIVTLARWYGEADEVPRRGASAREVAT